MPCPEENITGSEECDPPFPPAPSPPPPPVETDLCICDVSQGLTGVSGLLDNIAPYAETTGTTSEGFVVDVFVRKDTASSGTQLEDAFYLRWPAALTGEDFYDNASHLTDSGGRCGFAPTIYAFRGQWIVFRQQDKSNYEYPIVITTSKTGVIDQGILYSVTGNAATAGNLLYRDGSTPLGDETLVEEYIEQLALLPDHLNCPCPCTGSICPNLAFRIPACAPDVLYYRHYTENPEDEIRGGKIVILGALDGFECTQNEECVPHQRPWEVPLSPLSLSDTFYEWYTATNNIIAAVDPLRIYDVKPLGGLKELTHATNGILYLEADVGPGLRIYPPTSPEGGLPQECASGKIVLDIFGLPEVEVTGSLDPFEDRKSRNQVKETDLFVFERFEDDNGNPSRRGIDPHNTPASIFKVKAENMLPHIIAGDHRFTGKIAFESPAMEINATKLTIDDKALELAASPFLEFAVELVSGTAAQLVTGMSHDPDGDSYYYESEGQETDGTTPGNTYSGLTGELVIQKHTVSSTYSRTEPNPNPVGEYTEAPYDFVTGDYLNRGPGFNPADVDGGGEIIHNDAPGTAQSPEITGTEYSRATILSISNITGNTATVKVRVYNDVPFKVGAAYTSRSGVHFTITQIAGQAGNDIEINGGGIILNSTDGNKSILWANSNDAWTLNQNLAIDTKYHLLTPFNIANGATNFADNSLGNHNYWRVQQFLDATSITGTHCLDASDNGVLNFGFVTGEVVDGSQGYAPALSILPCGGIYIHNIECSPQFSITGGVRPNSVVITNEFGVLDHTQQDRIFVPVTGAVNSSNEHIDFKVGDVVGISANGALFLAQADTRDNAEVLGIVVQQITGGGDDCDIGGGSAASEGWLIAVGNLIDWTTGMCGLSSITTGSVYFLNPITGGTLVDCEPLEVGHIRKPVALAVNQSQLLVTNYEGVVNGDYFQENPVQRLDDLRDVDAPVTGANAVTGGQALVWNSTTQMWENTSQELTDLFDVDIADVTGGQALVWNSTTQMWENTSQELTDLFDVDIADVTGGQALVWNGTTSMWENTSQELTDLFDVDIADVTGGQILVWNGTTSMWENTSSRLPNTLPPIAPNDPGIAGEVRFDANHLYVCIGPDTWRRVALSTWSEI